MSDFELAQLNIAELIASLDSPKLKDFVDNLDRINALADNFDGFVWRLETEDGDATALRPFGEDIIINMSLWRSIDDLHRFVYQSGHLDIMRQRRRWFRPSRQATMVLWWVPAGHRPDFAEAGAKLQQLRSQGASAEAFTFGRPFPMPDTQDGSTAAIQPADSEVSS